MAVVGDAAAALGAVAAALATPSILGFPDVGSVARGTPFILLGVLAAAAWVATLTAMHAYRYRQLGVGNEEYRSVVNATVLALTVISVMHFLFGAEIDRGFVITALPMMGLAAAVVRAVLRARLHRARLEGRSTSRTLLVGGGRAITQMARHMERRPELGFNVVAACSDDPDAAAKGISVAGNLSEIPRLIADHGVETVIITDPNAFRPGQLRDLAWGIESDGPDLIVAPAITEVTGSRISSRPVAGLPLVHVEEPRFGLAARFAKGAFDRVTAAVALVVLSPVLAACAIAIKLTSHGPILHRQARVGLHGKQFTFLKLRTMVTDAEAQLPALREAHRADVLFKLPDDPRVTKVGRVMRRFSLDEAPQLLHVLAGTMSLVGPRPPLPLEVAEYEDHVHRRFRVKPGITGLWQVNGRSELSWDQSVHLDLHYVGQWSPSMDMAILLKTVAAVIFGRGAY